MRKLQCFTALASCLGLAVACSSSPEPRKQDPGLMDPDAKGGYDPTAEEKRLRDMMAVRVVNTTDNVVEEWDAGEYGVGSDLLSAIYDNCEERFVGTPGASCLSLTSECEKQECFTASLLCELDTGLAIVRGESDVTFTKDNKTYRVPPQSTATNTEIAYQIGASVELAGALTVGFAFAECPLDATGAGGAAEPRAPGQGTYAEYFASALTEFYVLGREAYFRAADLSVAAADAQLGSTPLREVALTRQLSGPALSRASAAHILLGERKGFQGDVANPVCTAPSLSPAAKQAVEIIRAAGVPPDYVLAHSEHATALNLTSLSLSDILNGNLPLGSVKQRLEYFGEKTINFTVQEEYSLSNQSFEDALRFLAEEIVALSRSRIATLSTTSGPGKSPDGNATYVKYAGVASLPPTRPSAYYTALARTNGRTDPLTPARIGLVWHDGDLFSSSPFDNLDTDDLPIAMNLSMLTQMYRYIATALFDDPGIQSSPIQSQVRAAVAPILTTEDTAGELQLCQQENINNGMTLGTDWVATVSGFDTTTGLAIVRGEDALSCAVYGVVEGAFCTIAPTDVLTLTSAGTPNRGFSQAVKVEDSTGFFEQPGRYYLLKPKVRGATITPGSAEAITGFVPGDAPTPDWSCQTFPIIPEAENAVANYLAPSPESCAKPRVNCAGALFDSRIPLEDELSTDGDPIESSWRHYLTLAKTDAAESDRLGDEYVNSTIGSLQRDEELDLRRIERQEKVAAALSTLQDVCGTSVDPSALFAALGMDESGQTDAALNDTGTPCPPDPPEGTVCLAGHLINDWTEELTSNKPEIQKLALCLNDFGNTAPASLGDEALCAWRTPDGYCANPKDGQSCPQLGTQCDPPDDATEIYTVEDFFDFFDTSQTVPPPGPETACTALRRIREGTSVDKAKDLESIRRSNVFQALTAREAARRLRVELDLGSYVSVSTGADDYRTGTTGGGPSGTWPCADSGRTDCAGGNHSSLFCYVGDCSLVGRSEPNERLYMAATAALVMAGDETSTLELPAYQYSGIWIEDPAHRVRQAFNESTSIPFTFEETYNDIWRTFTMPVQPTDFQLHNFAGNTTNPFDLPSDHPHPGAYYGIDFFPYQLGALTGTGSHQFDNFSFVRLPMLSDRTLPPHLWDGLAAYPRNVGEPTFETTPLLALLVGQPGRSETWFDTYAKTQKEGVVLGSGTGMKGRQLWSNGGYYADIATPRIVLNPRDDKQAILDGLELLCEAATGTVDSRTCDAANAPELHSLADLERLGGHMQCMGDSMIRRAVFTILQDVPKAAMEPLVNTQDATGEYGVAVSNLRSALLDIATAGPSIGREMRNFGQDVKELKHTMQRFGIQDQMTDIKQSSASVNALATCATTEPMVGVGTGMEFGFFSVSGMVNNIVSCINAYQQLKFTENLLDLEDDATEEERALAVVDFNRRFTDHVTALELEANRLTGAFETAARQIVAIKNQKQRARRAFADAVWMSTQQSEATAPLNTGFDRRKETARVRYQAAHTNAKRLAFLARRAIEQRIGTSLDSMASDLPLVDAPATWADSICSTSGIDYDAVTGSDGNTKTSYADTYIGNYVSKLENVVESYRLENNFHEGTDTTMVSLRDDIFKTRATCEVDSINLLVKPLDFDRPRTQYNADNPSWHIEGCLWADEYDGLGTLIGRSSRNCLEVVDAPDFDGDGAPDALTPLANSTGQARPVLGHTVRFGGPNHCVEGDVDCGFQNTARLVQTRTLEPGQYYFSYYGRNVEELNGGDYADLIYLSPNAQPLHTGYTSTMTGWSRAYVLFQVDETTDVEAGIRAVPQGASARAADELLIAAPQLSESSEFINSTEYALIEPVGFEAPDDNGKVVSINCEDRDGVAFRSLAWDRGCVKLCKNGYDTSCIGNSTTSCYWEASFQLSQRAWESGDTFGQGGFARGNFNYRIEDIGVNFVGTGVRDCSTSSTPSSCYSSGYLPYSIYHEGPFFVRNHQGEDFEALLFNGTIEHARGLAAERYLSNPLSSGDEQLISPYLRQEFRGRPLDAGFRIRIWDEPGVNFERLQDVQLMINYRYWTRNN